MRFRTILILIGLIALGQAQTAHSAEAAKPLRLVIAGLTHTHVHWAFESEKRGEFTIVGIAEPNRELAQRYSQQHGFDMALVQDQLEPLLHQEKPEAVAAFGSIYEHLSVVEAAAPRGIHVMVEKPLAVSMEHASRMAELAQEHGIHLLTNYETTWYPSNHEARQRLQAGEIGALRKVVVRDGHRGPKKIGINKEFLDWLTDPVQNGGGALTDFGCYGANLATWLMDGQRPLSVTAITQQLQPENHPKVDDEATILLTYPAAQVIIQASWNWPIGVKDMVLFGLDGEIHADNRHQLRVRLAEGYDGYQETVLNLEEREPPLDDPFAWFTAVIRGSVTPLPNDLSGLHNNLTVVEILDAARESARMGQTITLAQ